MRGHDGLAWLKGLSQLVPAPAIIIAGSEAYDVLNAASAVATSRGLEVAAVLKKPVTQDDLSAALQSARWPSLRPMTVIPDGGERKIIAALAGGNLIVQFQPKIKIEDYTFGGAEALLSGIVPEMGYIPPSEIVKIAKLNSLTAWQLADLTIRQGIDGFKSWTKAGLLGPVAINIPLEALEFDGFVEFLSTCVEKGGLRPKDVVIEISEDDLVEESSPALQNLIKLRMGGFGLALDDFGKKYSGISRLGQLPFTEVKIDISMVKLARSSRVAKNTIEHIISLCVSNNIDVTVEGVEISKDISILPRMGRVFIQGHIAAPKLDLAELVTVSAKIPHLMSDFDAKSAHA